MPAAMKARLALGLCPGQHPKPPLIAFTNSNRSPVALDMDRIAVLVLKSLSPFPVAPYLIAGCTYNMRAILIGLAESIFWMPLLECVCIPFLDGLPTVNRSYIRHKNRVFGVSRG
jgi:hypothetical protein